ncbi:hypothetical protein B9Z19DRAFT_133274 [Tuber borchii]|uniref:Uncharacterized protein n=1 Tax=Tuber borchii TaxID=42251 RepID=A0A2T6ZQP4_TUBBO|nr:hypothetical protein B9Z19DRAFT_133274 [Tuber borchii]
MSCAGTKTSPMALWDTNKEEGRGCGCWDQSSTQDSLYCESSDCEVLVADGVGALLVYSQTTHASNSRSRLQTSRLPRRLPAEFPTCDFQAPSLPIRLHPSTHSTCMFPSQVLCHSARYRVRALSCAVGWMVAHDSAQRALIQNLMFTTRLVFGVSSMVPSSTIKVACRARPVFYYYSLLVYR